LSNWITCWKKLLKITYKIRVHLVADKIIATGKGACLMVGKMSKIKMACSFVSVVFSITVLGSSIVTAANNNGTFLLAKLSTTSPPGASNLCDKYRWACTSTGYRGVSGRAALHLAKSVNSQINRQTDQIEDQAQYGRQEYWALPTSRGGDCEDIVLLKKKKLLEKGVASETLLIATVLDLNRNSHAVLVLRTKQGDFVLDSLQDKIIPWRSTGYTFLKMQNPKSLRRWDAVLAGGLIKDRPTGSK